ALLGWVERPQRPAHWALYLDRWVGAMPIHAARHVGRAGRRLGDPRITRRLVELLGVVECRGLALDALGEVGDPTAFDALFDCLGDPEHRFEVLLALAAATTPAQVKRLRDVADHRSGDPGRGGRGPRGVGGPTARARPATAGRRGNVMDLAEAKERLKAIEGT